MAGCTGSERYAQLPNGIDLNTVPRQVVSMTAERYKFIPEEVHVRTGTLVTLEVTALDGTHGLSLPDYGIDVSLPEKHPVSVRFYASTKGEHSFSCSHICGIGHLWMSGKIVVE